ncbi:MAG: hypothetical protein RRY26_03310 [Cellulosilyticaceae bacterium]
MDKRLSIQLIVRPDCKLVAVDNSNYYDLGADYSKHHFLEFLTYCNSNIPMPSTIKIRNGKYHRDQYTDKFSSEFMLPNDGTFSYYKLCIPSLEHFDEKNTAGELIGKYINLHNELFFSDDKLYKSNLGDNESYTKENVINNSIEISYIDAYKFVQDNNASQTFYSPVKSIFSVCKLQRCLVSLQKQLLLSNSKVCSYDKCSTDESLRNRRDFLLSAVYVFDYLKDIGNFTEAQRILDNLSACTSICGEDLNNINDCGCGNSI